ncbi:hypothetical protein KKG29_03815 [Patescibacteria group bacterium]|nr:hypothetical protein [Patescibacteria group bacterium]MBU4000271.1 hypothetical protein [Patescibacteria group bacterium]MBU4056318.1 hypothetical protein [Patescibacteria group bacterium]MBU4368279.1 hypothetical protein [Patescibacteria group bacterium]
MKNIRKRFERLIRICTNNVGCKFSQEYTRLAMQSEENFKVALEVKEEWNKCHRIDFRLPDTECMKYVLGYTSSWIAKEDVKFLRIEKRCAPDWGTYEGGEYEVAVYEVNGEEKMATDWDPETMRPLPMGCS